MDIQVVTRQQRLLGTFRSSLTRKEILSLSQIYPNLIHTQPHIIHVKPYRFQSISKYFKIKISKYSGDDHGLKLNEFLEHVQALSSAERVSEVELFDLAVHLFTGSALKRYMSQKSSNRFLNCQHLVFELRRTYMHPDLDALIKMKIYQRRQQKFESFHEFYFEMEKLFRTMSVQIPDFEKVQILQQNMRMDYKRQMAFIPIVDLQTLVAAGQKLDALNFSAYNKVFGAEKTVQVVEVQANKTKKKEKNNQPSTPPQVSGQNAAAITSQQNQNRNNRPPYQPNPLQSSGQVPSGNNQRARPPVQVAGPSKAPQPVPRPAEASTHPQLTLEEVVDRHVPTPTNTCFNCGRLGHHQAMCDVPRGVICAICGLRGFPTTLCPYCIKVKNGQRANENRRSQPPQA